MVDFVYDRYYEYRFGSFRDGGSNANLNAEPPSGATVVDNIGWTLAASTGERDLFISFLLTVSYGEL